MPILPRRNMDGTFDSAADCYEYAVTILQIKRGAKGNNYDPDRVGQCGIYGEYQQLDAIQVLGIIEQHDVMSNSRPSYFADYYLPHPIEPPPAFTEREWRRLYPAIANFKCGLAMAGFLGHCGRKGCRRKK